MEAKRLIGMKICELIIRNADEGIDINGKKFAPFSFSYWFAKKYKKKSKSKTKKGKSRYLKQAESAFATEKNNVFLTQSGAMLAAIDVVKIDEKTSEITIGFNDKNASKIAFYHNVSGAGKGRVIRRFFGVKKADEDELYSYAVEQLAKDENFAYEGLKQFFNR